MKYSPLIAAILSAAALVLKEAIESGNFDLKVVGFAVLIAAIGAASLVLKGKGSTLAGIIGTVGYVFYTTWNGGGFTWGEFILAAALAIVMLFSPSVQPEPEPI